MKKVKRIVLIKEFDDLPKDEQDKILEENRDINVEYTDWWEFVIDDANEQFEKEYGVSIDEEKVIFDLFREWISMPFEISDYKKFFKKYCNGDENRVRRLMRVFENNNIICRPYSNNYIVDFEEYDDRVENYQNRHRVDLQEGFQEIIVELRNKLLNKLRAECDYLISDEAIKETLISNDFGVEKILSEEVIEDEQKKNN